MLIEISDEALRGLNMTVDEARLDLATGLFVESRVTLGGSFRAESGSASSNEKFPTRESALSTRHRFFLTFF